MGSWITPEYIASAVRAFIVYEGSAFIHDGLVSASDWQIVAGGAGIVASLVWSWFRHVGTKT